MKSTTPIRVTMLGHCHLEGIAKIIQKRDILISQALAYSLKTLGVESLHDRPSSRLVCTVWLK